MPYSIVIDGKVVDEHFKKHEKKELDYIHNFYLGEKCIGQVFKMGKGNWSSLTFSDETKYRLIHGFRNRYKAADYILKTWGYID